MAKQIGPSAFAMAKGKYRHGKCGQFTVYIKFDLAPIKLTLLSRFVILFDESLLGLSCFRFVTPLDILAYTWITDVVSLLYQYTVDVLTLQALFVQPLQTTSCILFQPIANLGTNSIRQTGTLGFTAGRISGFLLKTTLNAVLAILQRHLFKLTDITGHCLSV